MKKNLLSTVFLGLSLGAFAQTDAAFWDFNSNPSDGNTATGIITPASGNRFYRQPGRNHTNFCCGSH